MFRGRIQGLTDKELVYQFNMSESGVSKFLKRRTMEGSTTNKKIAARPRITSRLVDGNIVRTLRS